MIEYMESCKTAVTVRHVFYKMVARGIEENTLAGYNKVSRMLMKGRRLGLIDWGKIIDDRKAAYSEPYFDSIEDCIDSAVNAFRYDRWKDGKYYIEMWAEKMGTAHILYPLAVEYGLTIQNCGGFKGITEDIAMRFTEREDKKCIIIYFGDYDPSGLSMDMSIKNQLSMWGCNISFERCLLTLEDTETLPRKALSKGERNKLENDPRTPDFKAKHNGKVFQVEMDVLDNEMIIARAEEQVLKYIPKDFTKILNREEAEKKRYYEG